MNNEQVFRVAPFSLIVWLWTVTYVVGFVFFATSTVNDLMNGLVPQPLDFFLTVVIFGILLYAWMRSVRSYHLTDTELVIARAGPGRMHIALGEILGAQAAPEIGTFFNIGILSIGGVLGWAGKVRVRNPSDLKSLEADVYGTNPRYSVALEMKTGRKLIVTPADPAGFAAALQKMGATAPVEIANPQPPASTSRKSTGAGAGRETRPDPDKPKPWLQGNKK
ncbi:MAG TPA: hypothetical protein VLQ48_05270 [Chloroflexia bacterium]|nr:hypothetical protein [Chloroflexia bacterium]